uniref:Receptor-like serine/threonine-protein kinase n=1 Tax=Kalanchoe fedtschenkoi TaxID=63787 RepID=A0A7N0V051_KALFE
MPTTSISFILLILLLSVFSSEEAVDVVDTLIINQPLTSNKTLVSSNGVFEFGFFKPGASLKQYVGVWYTMSKTTVIWVANRQLPVVKTPGKLTLRKNGVLEISDNDNVTVWSSNLTGTVSNPVAQLLSTGNFVVRDGDRDPSTDAFLWQGFDYPCDTRVPGMKIGYDVRRKRNLYQTSWKSPDDPAEGDYTFKLDITGIPQYFFWYGTREVIRSGPWNGQTFSGTPNMRPDALNRLSYTSDDEWIYFSNEPTDPSVLTRTVVNLSGTWQRSMWDETERVWSPMPAFVNDACDIYNTCGPYASCVSSSKSGVMCECLEGYVPKSQRDWDAGKWTEGCVTVRRMAENCSRGDDFTKHSNVKVPDTRNAYGDLSMSLEQCQMACLENCSCTAYGNWYVTYKGTGCVMWLGELNDIRVYADEGQEIYVRGDSSARTESIGGSNAKGLKVIIASSALSALVLVIMILLIIHLRKLRKTNQLHRHSQPHTGIRDENSQRDYSTEINNGDLDLPIFDIKTVSRATDNFSADNKLGQGGFGPVYKGLLQGGQEIAVKKLSQDSKQGSDEFKNEVMCIAKLQHRNLVKKKGYGPIRIYDESGLQAADQLHQRPTQVQPDFHLSISSNFNRNAMPATSNSLIILVLLLSVYSSEEAVDVVDTLIIDQPLSSNKTLVSGNGVFELGFFTPGSSLKQYVGVWYTMSKTTVIWVANRQLPVVKTPGKLTLRKNSVLEMSDNDNVTVWSSNLTGTVSNPVAQLLSTGNFVTWNLYNAGRLMDAMDEKLTESCDEAEVERAIHVGLLCVQESPHDRPNMASVVLMLSSDNRLPPPKAPGFFTSTKSVDPDSSSSKHNFCSANEMSITQMDPR